MRLAMPRSYLHGVRADLAPTGSDPRAVALKEVRGGLTAAILLQTSATPDDRNARGGRNPESVVVARVDVDAGDALAVEHLVVASVVLEREAEVEAVGPQFGHGAVLEVA